MMRLIQITEEEIEKIREHGRDTYPDECCGVIIGKYKDERPVITETRRMTNTNAGNPTRRYNIDPLELMKLEDELDNTGLTMLGIYHSHPDHPAKPSKFDLDHAWPNLSYIVLSVERGEARVLTSWRLKRDLQDFDEEEIIIKEK
jgi:proteasome lid subunit RPN8/RPN11